MNDVCNMCVIADALPDELILRSSDEWIVYSHPEYGHSGAVFIQARRHVEGLWHLDRAQTDTLGVMLQTTAAAVKDVTSAERVYAVSFGEQDLHFHVVMLPRTVDSPGAKRGALLVAERLGQKEKRSKKADAATLDQLRSSLGSHVDKPSQD